MNEIKSQQMKQSSQRGILMLRIVLLALLLIPFGACGAFETNFEDETVGIVKKPEVLSIVLSPPEAAPGEEVTASFLAADAEGRLTPSMQLWTLINEEMSQSLFSPPADGDSDLEAETETPPLSLDMLDMDSMGFFPSFTFTVPSADSFAFDSNGLAPMMLALLMTTETVTLDFQDPETMEKEFQRVLASSNTRTSYRTLVVSTRDEKNKNPRISAVYAHIGEDGARVPLVFTTSNDEDIAARRAAAQANPFIYSLTRNYGVLYFYLEVEDEGDLETNILYQWASLDGDFTGRRDQDQKWLVPHYRYPTEGQSDQTGLESVDARTDPNLYPIWAIIRDNGADDQLGQTWVEFYVRIVL